MTVFDPILSEADLESAMLAHLNNWLPTYIAEVERQKEIEPGRLRAIRSFTTRNEFQNWPEDQLPSVVCVSSGTATRPEKTGENRYRVSYVLGVAVVASAKDKESTNRLAKLYASAINAAILAKPSLGGFAMGTSWESTQLNDLPEQRGRTLAAAQMIYITTVENVVTGMSGPREPVEDPYVPPDGWPTVETTTIAINAEGEGP